MIKVGFRFRNKNSLNEYEVLRTTRSSWIVKRLDTNNEAGISHSGLKEAVDNGTYEDMDKKFKRIKLKF